MREQQATGFKAFELRDWRDVAKCSFCGANGHECERPIAGDGTTASGHPVTICDSCIDVCVEDSH
jgi:hypothetical protein